MDELAQTASDPELWIENHPLVFTAGIGEDSAKIRQRVCEQLGWLGLNFDRAANEVHGPRISTADSPVSAWVIATNEE